MKNRVEEIKKSLTAFDRETYQKKELLPELLKLQKEVVKETFNATHAENGALRLWDVEKHLEQMNESCGGCANDLLESFEEQSYKINDMIRAEMSGSRGEEKAYKCLQTLGRKNILLRNIELKVDERKTEIDDIVITNKAVFIIEVKNSSRDIIIDERGNYYRIARNGDKVFDSNIGEKMNEKEFLVRSALKKSNINDVPIYSFVVFTNSEISVKNNFSYFKECYLSQLPHIIDEHIAGFPFNDEKMQEIGKSILSAHQEKYYAVEVDVASFKNNFAELLAMLEQTKTKQNELEEFETRKKNNVLSKFFYRLIKKD